MPSDSSFSAEPNEDEELVEAPIRLGHQSVSVTADTSVSLRISNTEIETIFLRHEPLAMVQFLRAQPGGGLSPDRVSTELAFVEAARVRMEAGAAFNSIITTIAALLFHEFVSVEEVYEAFEKLKSNFERQEKGEGGLASD